MFRTASRSPVLFRGVCFAAVSAWLTATTAISLVAAENQKPNIADLIRQLADDDFTKREAAERELVAVGPDAAMPLHAASKAAGDPEVRTRAERCMVTIGQNAAKKIRDVGGIVSDEPLAEQNASGQLATKLDGCVRRVILKTPEQGEVGLPLLKAFPDMEYLWLQETECTNDMLAHLNHNFLRLKTLNFQEPKLTDEALAHLRHLSVLDYLGLNRCALDGTGFAHLADLKNLHGLSFDGSQLTDAGLSNLARLKHLQKLNISRFRLGDAGLAQFRNFENLESLILNDSPITNQGLKELAKLQSLRSLNLHGTRIDDDGMPTLSQLLKLEQIGLSATVITANGIERLAGMPALHTVSAYQTTISADDVKRLRQIMPKVNVAADKRRGKPAP